MRSIENAGKSKRGNSGGVSARTSYGGFPGRLQGAPSPHLGIRFGLAGIHLNCYQLAGRVRGTVWETQSPAANHPRLIGGQIARLVVGGVESRTREGVGKVAPAGLEVPRGRDELTPSKAAQSDILSLRIKPTQQNKKHQK